MLLCTYAYSSHCLNNFGSTVWPSDFLPSNQLRAEMLSFFYEEHRGARGGGEHEMKDEKEQKKNVNYGKY